NIAHRGGAGLAPENTITCFKQGLMFADMIEFDIQPTKDSQLVVYHDRGGIERTTNGKGKVPDLTLEYLRSLDVGSWFDQKFRGEKIPTFSEVLEETVSTNILYNIELKYYNPSTNWFENEIINIIKRYKIEDRTVITARYEENILRLHEIDSKIDLALLQKERTPNEYFKIITKLNLKTAQIRPSALEASFLKKCHDNNIRVFYFYADEPAEMKRVINLGIDGLLTNYPDRLKKILTKENKITF
ncbi:MAG: glycerophosphodiester phosphodiesterase, partial [Candidatus Hodarchaeota archaeon]